MVDHIGLERPFGQQDRFLRSSCQMGPALSWSTVGLSHTGDPAELSLCEVVPSDLYALDFALWASDRDHDPATFPDEAPFAIGIMIEAWNAGQIMAFSQELFRKHRGTYGRSCPVA